MPETTIPRDLPFWIDLPGEPDDPCAWLILYDDVDRRPEVFSGCGATLAAHARFNQVVQTWNCHLFVKVASNAR